MLARYPAKLNVTWTAYLRHKSTKYVGSAGQQLPGHDILSLLKENYTIKVWETLRAARKRQKLSQPLSLSLKMDLFDEYAYPTPFPKDIFQRIPTLSPHLEYIMLGQKGTGRNYDCG